MASDSEMDDGNESDYPDPNSSIRTPYPTLPQAGKGLFAGAYASPYGSPPPAGDIIHDHVPSKRKVPGGAQYPSFTDSIYTQPAATGHTETGAESADEGPALPSRRFGPANDFWSSYRGPIFGLSNDSHVAEEFSVASTGAPRKPKRARGGWKQALIGTEHEDLIRKPKAVNSRGRGKLPGRSRWKPVDPGRDFADYQRQASKAFLEDKLDDAHDLALKAIQANPEVFAAYSLLSQILAQTGREKDSIGALMYGALTRRVPSDWISAADRTMALDDGTPRAEMLDQARWCYEQALKVDRKNREARAGRLQINLELGEVHKARKDCRGLAREFPGDFDVLRQYAELCALAKDNSEILKAKEAYDKGFEHYKDRDFFGDPADQWSHVNVYLELMDQLGMHEEGISQLKQLARKVLGRKDETFWDKYTEDDREFDLGLERRGQIGEVWQGKASQDTSRYGNGLPMELRAKFGLFRLKMGVGHEAEALRHLEHLLELGDEIAYFYDIFYNIADALRQSRVFASAIKFYEPVTQLPEVANADILLGLAECYAAVDRREDAVECYLEVIELEADNVPARLGLAKVYELMGLPEKAMPLVNEVIKIGRRRKSTNGETMRFDSQRDSGKSTKRGRVSARKDAERAANRDLLDPGVEGPASADADDAYEPSQGASTPSPSRGTSGAEAEGTPTKASRRKRKTRREGPKVQKYGSYVEKARVHRMQEQEARVIREYDLVKLLWPAVRQGNDPEATEAWIAAASSLLEAFHLNCFYTGLPFTGYKRRDQGGVAAHAEMTAWKKRLKESVQPDSPIDAASRSPEPPHIFSQLHGIPFTDWHRTFVDLAMLYAGRGEKEKCYEVLTEHLSKANVFCHDAEMNKTQAAAAICCGMIFNDSAFVVDRCRQLILETDCRSSMPYQLLSALARLCHGDSELTAGASQKFLLRCVKALDHNALPSKFRDKLEWGGQGAKLQKRLEKGGDQRNVLDAGLLTLYGHSFSSTGHAPSAVPYYLRALALQPDSAAINLSLSVAHTASAMKKNTDNRQYNIGQGLAFMERYADIRKAGGEIAHLQEIEFNRARLWHFLGLMHLAVPKYEKVLEMYKAARDESEDGLGVTEGLAQEAAFAVQQCYALAGDEETARSITEQWLVF